MIDSFRQRRERMIQLKARREGKESDVPRKHIAKAVFGKCPDCGAMVPKTELARTLYVCPKCGYHHPVGAYLRLSMLLDSKSFRELDEKLTAPNALKFPGYDDKLQAARKSTGLTEGVVTARGKIDGRMAVFAVLDSRFSWAAWGWPWGRRSPGRWSTPTGQAPPHHLLRQRRRPDAGGHPLPDADGQDQRRPGAVSRSTAGSTSPCSPTPPPAGSPPPSPPWGTSPWPSRGPSSALPAPGSSSRPSARPCPRASSARNTWRSTALWTRSSPGARCGRPSPSC